MRKPHNAVPFYSGPDYSYAKAGDDYSPDHKKKIKLACGNASGLSLPVSGIPVWQVGGIGSPSLIVGSVTLDTSEVLDPAVKIDLSGTINFLINQQSYTNNGLRLSLDFKLSKICDGDKFALATWNYHKSVHLDNYPPPPPPPPELNSVNLGLQVDFREPFTFSWCECQPCPGCCTYIVEIVNINSYQIESASITNTNITAMAVGC